MSIGTLIGALVGAPIADRIGRKWSISFWCIILCVGVTVQISSSQGKWYQVAVGRLIAGLGVGALSLIVPMYQGESGPRHIRGALISLYQLFITLGIFVAYCIDFGTEAMTTSASWRIPMGITYLWAIILGVGIIFFPNRLASTTDTAKSTVPSQTWPRFMVFRKTIALWLKNSKKSRKNTKKKSPTATLHGG